MSVASEADLRARLRSAWKVRLATAPAARRAARRYRRSRWYPRFLSLFGVSFFGFGLMNMIIQADDSFRLIAAETLVAMLTALAFQYAGALLNTPHEFSRLLVYDSLPISGHTMVSREERRLRRRWRSLLVAICASAMVAPWATAGGMAFAATFAAGFVHVLALLALGSTVALLIPSPRWTLLGFASIAACLVMLAPAVNDVVLATCGFHPLLLVNTVFPSHWLHHGVILLSDGDIRGWVILVIGGSGALAVLALVIPRLGRDAVIPPLFDWNSAPSFANHDESASELIDQDLEFDAIPPASSALTIDDQNLRERWREAAIPSAWERLRNAGVLPSIAARALPRSYAPVIAVLNPFPCTWDNRWRWSAVLLALAAGLNLIPGRPPSFVWMMVALAAMFAIPWLGGTWAGWSVSAGPMTPALPALLPMPILQQGRIVLTSNLIRIFAALPLFAIGSCIVAQSWTIPSMGIGCMLCIAIALLQPLVFALSISQHSNSNMSITFRNLGRLMVYFVLIIPLIGLMVGGVVLVNGFAPSAVCLLLAAGDICLFFAWWLRGYRRGAYDLVEPVKSSL